jgi:Fructose-2,6-bisphosphatase
MNVIGLLRHGPTSWNRDKRIQGIRDIPLDREAFEPSPWRELLLAHGPWDLVVTSPLSRASETARLLFPDRPLNISDDLREQDWGEWTGLTITELRRDFPAASRPRRIRAGISLRPAAKAAAAFWPGPAGRG